MVNEFNLEHLSGIRLSGPDAENFAQSQFVGDISQLDDGRWMTTAWCDPKGRCLAVILLKRHQGNVDLVFPLEQLATLERLRLFAIGRTVEFTQSPSVCASFDGAVSARTPGIVPGVTSRRLWLCDGAGQSPSPATLRRWRLADLAAAIPWLYKQTSARFLPQFLNLDTQGGLSFSKGCYPGQEVIARLHYRGTVKYRLIAFRCQGNEPVWEPGETLRLNGHDGKLDVLDAVQLDELRLGLAVGPSFLQAGQRIEVTDSQEIPASLQLVHPSTLC